MNKRSGLTAIEIITVMGSTAFLVSVLMPVLAADRDKAKQAQCGAQMKQWGFAILMYADDNHQKLPWFEPAVSYGSIGDPNKMWNGAVEPYLSGKHAARVGKTIFTTKIRQCPGGKRDNGAMYSNVDHWKGWIGVNYGAFNRPDFPALAPFVYGSDGSRPSDPIVVTKLKHPESWMMMLDTQYYFVYTPLLWKFDDDQDADGLLDTMSSTMMMYNGANPKVHNNGCNVGLVDGHVEWVAFKDLWKTDASGNVTHTFWYND